MDIAYVLGEFFLSLSAGSRTRRRRKSIAEIKAEADERFAASSPRAAARKDWQDVCEELFQLAARYGVETEGITPFALVEQLQLLNILSPEMAGMLTSLGLNFQPQAEAILTVADAQAVRLLAKQYAAELAAL